MSSNKEKIVSPGEKIGVIEMFEPGEGAYEEKGVIYSKLLGKMKVNKKARKVNVVPINPGTLPKRGDILTARVIIIRKQQTLIDIVPAGDLNPKFVFEGSIHISNASDQYIDSLNDAFKPYDLLRVKVSKVDDQPFQCITSQPDLGVILAFCSECGEELIRDRGNRLVCPACRNIEQRKLAKDYGNFELNKN